MKDEILVGRNENYNNLYSDFSKNKMIERQNNFNLTLRKNKLLKSIQKKRFDKKEKNLDLNLNNEIFINISSNINQLKKDLNSNDNHLITRALFQIRDFFQESDLKDEKEINFFFQNFFEEITKILLLKNYSYSNLIIITFINIFANKIEIIVKIESKYKLQLINDEYLSIYKNLINEKIEELSGNLFWFLSNLFLNQESLCYNILEKTDFIQTITSSLKTKFPKILSNAINCLFSICNIKNYNLISQLNEEQINNLVHITYNLIEVFRYKNNDENKEQSNKIIILDTLHNLIEIQRKNEIYEILSSPNYNFVLYFIQYLQYNMTTYIKYPNFIYYSVKFLYALIKNGNYSSINEILSFNLFDLFCILYKNKKCLKCLSNEIISYILTTIQNICEFRYEFCLIILNNEIFNIIINDMKMENNTREINLNCLKIISDILSYQKKDANDYIISKNIIFDYIYPIFNEYYQDMDILIVIIHIFHYLLEYNIHSDIYIDEISKIRELFNIILEKIQFSIPPQLYTMLKKDTIQKENKLKITFSYE